VAAQRTVEQIELFFSGMAWYLTEHPAWGRAVFEQTAREQPGSAQQLDPILRELSAPANRPRRQEAGRS
jgi:hypothetical protein